MRIQRSRWFLGVALAVALGVGACTPGGGGPARPDSPATSPAPAATQAPAATPDDGY